jgi:tetratricopeptide (TPR) repeat protein
MKKAIFLCFLSVLAVGARAQNIPAGFDLSNYGVHIEPDKRVLVVLATVDAARTQNPTGPSVRLVNTKLSPDGSAFRSRLETELTVPDDLRQKISTFLRLYRQRRPTLTDAEVVTPFIAMAYSLSPPPDLADPVITSDLPGDLLDVLDFAPLVREFYRRSGISAKLDGYIKDYQAETDAKLRGGAREMVSEMLGYLHTKPQTIYAERVKVQADKNKRTTLKNTEIREHERKFTIVPEMLAPAGNVQFLNIRDDYNVILPPDTDLSQSEARRAFIQYVVDAIILTHANEVSTIIPGVKQLVNERRQANPSISPDAYLAVSRSLVAAIDAKELEYARNTSATFLSRQKIAGLKTDEEKKQVTADLEKFKQAQADETALRLSEDYENGAVLSFYFAQQLKGMEEAGFDIAASMREMLLSFDPAKESGRLAEFAEARKRAAAVREARKNNTVVTEIAAVENPVTTKLIEIEKTIADKDFARASTDLNALLKANPHDSRIYYNLGRVSMLEAATMKDPDEQAKKIIEAKNAYAGVLTSATPNTDRALLSLTYVALARIYEFGDNKDYAVKLYDKAIELGDVPGGGLKQAIEGKQRLVQNP